LFGSELNDEWKSKKEILRQYRAILLGYYLLGDDRNTKPVEVSRILATTVTGPLLLEFPYKGCGSWWYDTHARHRRANVGQLAIFNAKSTHD
jgi:hypothetical protein